MGLNIDRIKNRARLGTEERVVLEVANRAVEAIKKLKADKT
ncbi:MAG: hypothetical protein QXW39_05630 [Candidatus Bathyarchaeia archaeon]